MAQLNPASAPFMAGAVTQQTTPEPGSLTQRASGDVSDFWELWGQYKDDLLSHYCLRWMDGNRADAEDALSEASLRAWHGWPTTAPELTNVKGWFIRLVQNHCINLHQARMRQRRVVQCVEDITIMADEQATADGPTSPEDVALRREMDRYIRRAIDDLPPRLQVPAHLHFLQDIAYPDIAIHLSLSPANVRKRIQQARTLLRARLSAYLAGAAAEGKHVRLPPDVRLTRDKARAG